MPISALSSLLAAALPALLPAVPPVHWTGADLPPGPAAATVARIPVDARPAALPVALAAEEALVGTPWSRTKTWELWADWVADESPEASASLALLAVAQARYADAWAHLDLAAADPAQAAMVLPHLWPGVPLGSPIEAGGVPGALPDGVLLRPTLPPVGTDPEHPPRAWTATAAGLRVGDAVIDLRLVVDDSGVQIDLVHRSGGKAVVRVLVPEPVGVEIRIEYLDWFRLDTLREPIEIELEPGAEPRVIFGRVLERSESWPSAGGGGLPEGLRRGGLRLIVPANDPELELLRAVGAAIGRAAGVATHVTLVEEIDATPPISNDSFGATDVRLAPGPDRARKLAWLVSAVERYRMGLR